MNDLAPSPSSIRVAAPPRESSEIVLPACDRQGAARPSLYDFSAAVQTEVNTWIETMKLLEAGKTDVPTLVAANKWVKAKGWSSANIYKKLAAWKKDHDWFALLDKTHFSDLWNRAESRASLPAEFVRWAGGQPLGNQRKSLPSYRAIIRQWKRWHAGDASARIPGYDVCPPFGPNGKHPLGWSEENLRRAVKLPKAEIAMARQGTSAARAFLPFVPGTRDGARYLEYVFFDDVWLDREVIVPGYLHPARVLQLGGMDYASGYYLHFGQRPDLPNDDGTRERLKRRDFLWLVAALLDKYGYPADYDMHLILERGTATMSHAEARVLYDISGGRIKVCYTSMEGQMVMAWDEKKNGKSTGKAVLESFHNLFHNEQAFLPGQVGMDRDHCPAALFGLEKEVVSLQKIGLMMPAELRPSIQMPLPSCDEAYLQTLEIVKRINSREDHKCEGFDDVVLWRMPGGREYRNAKELVSTPKAILDILEYTTRKESPAERLQKLAQGVEIKRLPRNIWHRFYEDSHALAKVKRMQIEVKIGNKTMFFGPDDLEKAMPDGTEVLAYFSPHEPDVAYIVSNGRYVDAWNRLKRIRRDDSDGLSAAIRRSQTAINITASRVQNKQAEELIRQERRINANEELIAEAGFATEQGEITPGAAALQDIGRRIAEGKQNSPADVVATILKRPMKQENPAIDENSWV